MSKVANVLFVHGAWANSSAWAKVLPLVERAGVNATAVQLPLTSLADDAAAVKRAIELVDGKVVLVGHSYGGAVISEAGNEPQVSGLVYVAGFAPAAGESAGSLGAGGPVTRLPETLRSDAHGFLKLSREGVDEAFAQDLSDDERAIVFATQGPVSGNALGGTVTSPAWEHKPAWYLIANQDRAIHPELQQTMARRINATTISIAASHVAMLSQPEAVSEFVLRAIG
jgi:pimeloyl-ACP methyl ester carboxylesterase